MTIFESARESVELASFVPLALPEMFVGGYSTRVGGVSPPPYDTLNLSFRVGDQRANVLENRQRLAQAVGLSLDSFVFSQLAHRDGVATVSRDDRGRGAHDYESAIAETDVLITSEAEVVLAVNVADCVPIILVDKSTPAVGVVHAGWRGTVAKVAARAVRAMRDAFGSRPENVEAFIGPSIGPSSYAVSADVAQQALAAYHASDVVSRSSRGLHLDLWRSNARCLQETGVAAESIHTSGIDTKLCPAFFSARRESTTGRFAGVVAIRRA